MKKIAVVSSTVPPERNGQAIMIKRLFENISPKYYCYIQRKIYGDYHVNASKKQGETPRIYRIRPFIPVKKSSNTILKILSFSLFFIEILPCTIKFIKILRKESIDVVVSCSDSLVNMPSAWLACKYLKLDFYPYFFDHYKYQQRFKILRYFSGFFERRIVHSSKKIIVPNEMAYKLYKQEYGIECVVIHNPCDISKYPATKENVIDPEKRIRIVYTGDIYTAQIDALKSLVFAVKELRQKSLDLKIELYTNENSKRFITDSIEDIEDIIIFNDYVSPSEVHKVHMDADMLFLPLSFKSRYPIELINTSAPGKTGEYLASGRPILVHAPKDSFLSWYFRKYKCGAVVDKYDEKELTSVLERLLSDKKLQKEYMKNARIRAKEDFDIKKSQNKFIGLFK